MPKEDVDNGDLDDCEREIEEFKRYTTNQHVSLLLSMINNIYCNSYIYIFFVELRFCMDSTPNAKREKIQVNFNAKDLFSKKKSGLSCA